MCQVKQHQASAASSGCHQPLRSDVEDIGFEVANVSPQKDASLHQLAVRIVARCCKAVSCIFLYATCKALQNKQPFSALLFFVASPCYMTTAEDPGQPGWKSVPRMPKFGTTWNLMEPSIAPACPSRFPVFTFSMELAALSLRQMRYVCICWQTLT